MVFINFIITIFVTALSLYFLYLGFRLFQKKAVIINSNIMSAILGITFLMIIGGMLIKVISSVSKNWSLLLFVPIYVVVFLLIKKLFGNYIVFNIQENILYRSIFYALSHQKIDCEKRGKKIIIPSTQEEMSIVSYPLLNSAIVYFTRSSKNGLLEEAFPTMKKIISEKPFNEFSWVGLVYVIVGVFLLGISALLAIATWGR